MATPSANQYFEAIHTGPGDPTSPNLFTAAELVAGSFSSAAVSSATSTAVSTVNAAAPDSSSISQAKSQAVSAATNASIADSKAVSGSANASVADSKALSVSGSTSMADSKAVSVAVATPTVTAVVYSAAISAADSKAVSDSITTSTADSKATSIATAVSLPAKLPAGSLRSVASLSSYISNNAVFNVLDYGALGDNSTDNSTFLQNALNDASTNGGTVFIPPGTYRYSTGLVGKRNVHLRGAGMGSTVLIYTGAGQGFTATGTGDVWYSGIFDLTLKTVGTVPPYPATYGVRVTDACDFQMERVQLTRWGTSGVLLEGTVACVDIGMAFCDIHENQQGITVGGNNVIVNHVAIVGCKLRASEGWNCFVPQDVRNWTIIGNNLEAGKTGGLSFAFGEGIAIISNYFEVTTAVPAINITGIGSMYGVTIQGNNIHGTGVANGASAITFGLTGGAIYGVLCAANSMSGYQVGIESNGVQSGQFGPNAFPNTLGTKYKLTVSQETAKGLIIIDDTGPRGNGGFSADKGDADFTLTSGVGDQIIYYNTPLTAPRAVTLNIVNNAKDGDKCTVIRTAAATGASALNVGPGPLKALAAGQWCDCVFDGANAQAWKLLRFGSL